MDLTTELEKLNCGLVKKEEPLTKYTTYQLKGTIKNVIFPENIEQLKKLLNFLREKKERHLVIGSGSNIIFSADYYDGVLIKLNKFQDLKIEKDKVFVESGYNLSKLAYLLSKKGLLGLEFATGIPGTLGGAVYMNAGAYGSAMNEVIEKVVVLTPKLEIKELSNAELKFAYRQSFLQTNKEYICLAVTLQLKFGDIENALALIADRKQRRLNSQPLDFPSAGSVFRNPENDYAGRLIEELNLKGYQIGDAKVSCKHANFIINIGKASGQDVQKLIQEIQTRVFEKYAVKLKVEQEIIE